MFTKMKARLFLVWGSVIVGAFATPLIASKAINAVAENEWRAAQAAAKKAGVPLDVKTALAGYAAGPDQDNAAKGVRAVLRKVLKPPRPESYTEFQGGFRDKLKDALKAIEEENKKGPAANLQRMERAVAAFEPHLSELQTALDKPNWNFKREWEMGAAMLLPDPAALKSLSKVLLAKARVNWSKNPAESAQAVSSVVNYANHLQSEPNNICVLVAMSCRSLAYKTAVLLSETRSTVPNASTLLLPVFQQPTPSINWRQLWHVDNASTLESLWLVTSAKGFHDLGLREGNEPNEIAKINAAGQVPDRKADGGCRS